MTSTQISKNILGGLSQQPEETRLLNQARECENAYLSPLDGAAKRMPSQHVASITGSGKLDRFIFTMDRDDEQYLIMCGGGTVRIFDADGDEVPVRDTENAAGGYALQTVAGSAGEYFGALGTYAAGRDDLRAAVVVDTAFVVNRNVIVAEEVGPTRVSWDVPKRTAGVFIRQFNWGTSVTIKIKVANPGGTPKESVFKYSTGTNKITYALGPAAENDYPRTWVQFNHDPVVDGWILETDMSSGSSVFQEAEPFVDSSQMLFADPASGVQADVADFGVGAFAFDPATRVAKLIQGSSTADLYFGIVPPAALVSANTSKFTNTEPKVQVNRSYPINTEFVCHTLREQIEARGTATTGIDTVTPALRTGGSSFLIETEQDILEFSVTDSVGNTYATGWTSEVEDITDLPLEFRHGALVYVSGLEGVRDAGYWVRFSSDKWAEETERDFDQFNNPDYVSHFGPGLWLEAALPEAGKGKLTKSTMPVMIRRSVDDNLGTYTSNADSIFFDVRFTDEWGERTVGSTKNNKAPSFVGKKLQEIFYWQGRLGFTSEANVCMSQTGELYNFWRTTQLSVPDDERIDVASTEGGGRVINYVVPMNERLLAFTQDSQIALGSRSGVLSPRTIEAPLVSRFEGLTDGPPVPFGRSIMMPYRNAAYVGIRELIPFGDLNDFAPVDLTQNVPRLIPQNESVRIVTNPNDSIAFAHSAADPNTLYCFKYLKQSDTEYSFAAWNKWTFTGEVQDMVMLNETLYLVMFYENGAENGTALEKIEFGPGQTDEDSDLLMHLDRKKYFGGSGGGITVTFTPDNPSYGNQDTTTYTFSTAAVYDPDTSPTITAVTAVDGAIEPGTELTVLDRGSNSIIVRGVPTNTKVWFGVPYTFKWSANRVLPRTQDGTPTRGRRTVNSEARVSFDRSRYFQVVLDHKAGSSYTTTFSNDESSSIGIGPVEGFDSEDIDSIKSGTVRVPLHGAAHNLRMSITNDSPFPSNITGIEWVSTQNRQSGVSGVF